MLLRSILLAGMLSLGAGCASHHAAMRGSVQMKVSDTEAHVCLSPDDVVVNDRVELYKQVCTTAGKRTECKNEAVAEGVVTERLNDHYAVVTFPAGTWFEEKGYLVEPIR
jgi:hypothetical protein